MKKHRIVHKSVAELVPYASNARTHSTEQVQQIAGSIKEFGFKNPLLIDSENLIIAGHGRLAAAHLLGIEKVPCIVLDHLTEAQKRAYVIADNKLALNAGWDDELLAAELSHLCEVDFDITLTGFSEEEFAAMLDLGQENTGQTDDDAAPDVEESTVTEQGDCWILGTHRVMCGDSTSQEALQQTMDGVSGDLIFTDPPYGMSYGGGRAPGSSPKGARVKAHGMIKNDDLAGEKLVCLVRDALNNARGACKAGAAAYVCFTWRTYAEFEQALAGAGMEVKACIVWDKQSIGLGNSHYRPQHEFIFYSGGQWYGDKAQADVWALSRGATTDYVHPTQKPVALIERALENSSKAGDVVVDIFGGSGSTVIACEKLGRMARVIDLDPKYVDVIVRRWQEWTGQEAIHGESGKKFNDCLAASKSKSSDKNKAA